MVTSEQRYLFQAEHHRAALQMQLVVMVFQPQSNQLGCDLRKCVLLA